MSLFIHEILLLQAAEGLQYIRNGSGVLLGTYNNIIGHLNKLSIDECAKLALLLECGRVLPCSLITSMRKAPAFTFAVSYDCT